MKSRGLFCPHWQYSRICQPTQPQKVRADQQNQLNILGYTELLSGRESMQQGTTFVHKGLHIFMPVLHHLFCCVLFCREGL